jgi:hypothetical protein
LKTVPSNAGFRDRRKTLVDVRGLQAETGALTIYRRHNKPALGPVGDTLDDLEPPFGGSAVRRQL